MAINLGDEDNDEGQESGGELRKKLEAALAENRQLKAQSLLAESKFTLVKPEDLAKVDSEKMAEVAEQLQKERLDTQKSLIRDAFVRKGYEGDELDEAVEAFLGNASEDDPLGQVNEVAKIGGSRPPLVDEKNLHGLAAIEAGLEAAARKRSK